MDSTKRILIPAITALMAAACTTMAYEGPARPDNEVATLASSGTLVHSIDGKEVSTFSGGNYASYRLLPGRHVIGVLLNESSWNGMRRTSRTPLPVEFTAEAGKTYVTRPIYNGKQWRPEIVERAR